MPNASTNYDPKRCAVTLMGERVEGWADGDDAIMVQPNTDRTTRRTGADGYHVVSRSADRSGTITLKLLPSSPAHKRLLQLDRAGAVQLPGDFSLRDTTTGEGHTAVDLYIKTAPSMGVGTTSGTRTWVLDASTVEPIR